MTRSGTRPWTPVYFRMPRNVPNPPAISARVNDPIIRLLARGFMSQNPAANNVKG